MNCASCVRARDSPPSPRLRVRASVCARAKTVFQTIEWNCKTLVSIAPDLHPCARTTTVCNADEITSRLAIYPLVSTISRHRRRCCDRPTGFRGPSRTVFFFRFYPYPTYRLDRPLALHARAPTRARRRLLERTRSVNWPRPYGRSVFRAKHQFFDFFLTVSRFRYDQTCFTARASSKTSFAVREYT